MQNTDFLDIIGKIDLKYVEDAMSSGTIKTSKILRFKSTIPILAAGLLLVLSISGICYHVFINSQLYLKPPKNEEIMSTNNSESSEQKTSTMILPLAASAEQRFLYSLNSLYADPSYRLCDIIQCSYINPDYCGEREDLYNWRLELYVKDNWFIGNYSKKTQEASNSNYESTGTEIKGTFTSPFTRLNDYSFHANVQIDVSDSHADSNDQTVETNVEIPSKVISSESYHKTDSMEAFSNPNELILFLPNTPKTAIPECINKDWIETLLYSDSLYTQRFFVYNVNENVMYIANANPSIPETKEPDDVLMQKIMGSYREDTEESSQTDNGTCQHSVECCIYQNSSSKEYKMDLTIDDRLIFEEMDILQRVTDVDDDGDLQLVLWGKEASSGSIVFFIAKIIEGDESDTKPIRLTVAESNLESLPVSSYLPIIKAELDNLESVSHAEPA